MGYRCHDFGKINIMPNCYITKQLLQQNLTSTNRNVFYYVFNTGAFIYAPTDVTMTHADLVISAPVILW
mgnify:CR=1 FL=1